MADISVRLNGDNSNFKGMLDDSAQAAGTIAGQISKKFELKDIGKAMATALGINLEKIAENVARIFTGISKAEEEALRKSEGLSDRLTELTIKNMRATLSEEQNYQLAIKERDKLLREIATTEAKTGVERVALDEKKIKLEERIGEIIAYEKKQREEMDKQYAASQEKRVQDASSIYDESIKQLSVEDKILSLKSQIRAQQYLIASGAYDAVTQAEQEKVLQKQKNDLVKLEVGLRGDVNKALTDFFGPMDELSKAQQERLKKEKETTEELEKQKGIITGITTKTKEAAKELKVMIGYTQEDVTQMSAAQLAAYKKKLQGNVSDIEQKYRGGTVGSAEYDIGANLYRKTLKDIEAEQKLRSDFSQSSVYGETYLRDKYDTATFDRLKQLFNPDAQLKQAKDISDISQNLRILLGGG